MPTTRAPNAKTLVSSVLPGQPGRVGLAADNGTDTTDLVGADRDTDAGAAKDDALVALAGSYGFTNAKAEVAVVHAFRIAGAQIQKTRGPVVEGELSKLP